MAINGVNRIMIAVHDLEAAKKKYHDLLGAKKKPRRGSAGPEESVTGFFLRTHPPRTICVDMRNPRFSDVRARLVRIEVTPRPKDR